MTVKDKNKKLSLKVNMKKSRDDYRLWGGVFAERRRYRRRKKTKNFLKKLTWAKVGMIIGYGEEFLTSKEDIGDEKNKKLSSKVHMKKSRDDYRLQVVFSKDTAV